MHIGTVAFWIWHTGEKWEWWSVTKVTINNLRSKDTFNHQIRKTHNSGYFVNTGVQRLGLFMQINLIN